MLNGHNPSLPTGSSKAVNKTLLSIEMGED
jgi:hypothetical protein